MVGRSLSRRRTIAHPESIRLQLAAKRAAAFTHLGDPHVKLGKQPCIQPGGMTAAMTPINRHPPATCLGSMPSGPISNSAIEQMKSGNHFTARGHFVSAAFGHRDHLALRKRRYMHLTSWLQRKPPSPVWVIHILSVIVQREASDWSTYEETYDPQGEAHIFERENGQRRGRTG
jgi:hypothetical protein